MTYNTLILNPSYQPVKIFSLNKTITMLYNKEIETLVEWDDVNQKYIKLEYNKEVSNYSKTYVYKIPIIAKFTIKHPNPKRKKIYFNKEALLLRDNFKCCYCGKQFDKKEDLEIEHIMPQSRGGATNFLNCVCACRNCNSFKSDKTPEEAGMKLLVKPFIPDSMLLLKKKFSRRSFIHESWYKYLTQNAQILI
jgi:5-methylcytosine-specific restriction endonuclease McrA